MDAVRDVLIRLKVQLDGAKLPPLDVSAAEKEAARLAKAHQQAAQTAGQAWANVAGKGSVGVTPTVDAAMAQSAKASTDRATKLSESYTRAGDAYKGAAEGAFTFARGAMLVTAANEDDLAAMVKKLAIYQGYFDITKGGYEVIKGVSVGTKALAVAHGGAAAAASVQGIATNALAASLVGARGAAIGVYTALTGPVGLAIVGTTAAVAIGAKLWYDYSGAAEAAAEKSRKAAEKETAAVFKRISAIQELGRIQARQNANEIRYSSASAQREQLGANSEATLRERIQAAEADQVKERNRQLRPIIAATDLAVGGTRYPGEAIGFNGPGDNADPYRNQTNSAKEYLRVLKIAQQTSSTASLIGSLGSKDKEAARPGYQEEQEKRILAVQKAENFELDKKRKVHETIQGAIQKEISAGRERYALLGQEESRLRSMAAQHAANTKAIQEQRKALQSASLSQAEKFGQLDPFQQQQLKDIGERLKSAGGSIAAAGLNQNEIELLKSTGFADSSVSRHFIDKGNAAGAETILKNLGSQNVTPQESLMGGGPEGESRDAVLAFRQSFQSFSARQSGSLAEQVRDIKMKADQEITEAIKALEANDVMLEALKDVRIERDRQFQELISAVQQSQAETDRVLASFAQSNRNRNLANRQN